MSERVARKPTVLSLRDLNRALLARQMLLERARYDVVAAVERLGALQAQWPRAPYVGLWSRLQKFTIGDLEDALETGQVVKASLMRGTLHIASARDYPFYATASPAARRALWPSTQPQLLAFFAKESPEAKRYVAGGGQVSPIRSRSTRGCSGTPRRRARASSSSDPSP